MKGSRLLALSALVTSSTAFGGLFACGSSSNGSDDSADATPASDAGSGADSATVVVSQPNGGATPDGGDGGPAGDADSAANPPAAACDPTEKLDMSQIFVSAAGTANTQCNEVLPCTSIQAGIAAAVAQKRSTVYVDQGLYPEQLTLNAGIAIRGARSRTDGWAPICGDARLTATKVQPPAGVDRAVIAKDLGGAGTLEALDIQYATVAQPGQSMYGIFATGATTTLSLVDVTMVVPAGGAGANGVAGAAGITGGAPDCGHGVVADPPAATPSTAATSAGAHVGYSAAGATPTTGGTGIIGGNGGSTSAAGTAGCADNYVGCKPDPTDGVPCASADEGTSCVGGGSGCGGTAGGIGGGGGSGGSSIALYAYDARVTVARGQLQPGAGGNGGTGGAGGAAGGATGGSVSSTVCTGCGGTGAACGCTGHAPINGFVGAGSTPGAAGPAGAGAAGGDSWAFYANASNVTYDVNTLFGPLPAALGGTGTPSAAGGSSGIHN